jgi:hypothetical protein
LSNLEIVVPAHAGTHTYRPRVLINGRASMARSATMGPRIRGDDNDRALSKRYRGHFGGSKPFSRQRAAMACEVNALMKARAAVGSVLLAGMAAA